MNLVNKKNGELSIDLTKSAWGLPYFTSLTSIIIWNSKEAENVNAQKQFIDHLVILPPFFLLAVTLMTHSVVISTDLSPPFLALCPILTSFFRDLSFFWVPSFSTEPVDHGMDFLQEWLLSPWHTCFFHLFDASVVLSLPMLSLFPVLTYMVRWNK